MSTFILHHYPMSPYSEKVRAMLNYAGIEWQSLICKEMPPRPTLKILTGNYARVPVAQIGADIFCDSNLIAVEIARMANKPELDLNKASDAVRNFVDEVEGDVFFACVLSGGSAELRKKVMSSMSYWDLARFFIDRVNMGRKATVKVPGLRESQKIVRQQLERIESMLADDFLFGDKPNIGDFAAYHSLWFVRDAGEKSYVKKYPKVMAWMDRIKAFTKSDAKQIAAKDALASAKNAKPLSLPSVSGNGFELSDKKVAIAPSDYRQWFTEGLLKAETETRWIIERNQPETGSLHVHFPKRNYQIKFL